MSKSPKQQRRLCRKQKVVEHCNFQQNRDDPSCEELDRSKGSNVTPTLSSSDPLMEPTRTNTMTRSPAGFSRKIEFVFPKSQDGNVRAFIFGEHNLDHVEESSDGKKHAKSSFQDKIIGEATKSKMNESIEDILYPQKKMQKKERLNRAEESSLQQEDKENADKNRESQESTMKDSRQHDGVCESGTESKKNLQSAEGTCKKKAAQYENTQRKNRSERNYAGSCKEGDSSQHVETKSKRLSTADSNDQHLPGKLSGLSVEDAVRDKFGCRPRANSTDGELNLPRRGLCDERMVLEAHKWNLHRNNGVQVSPRGFVNLGNTCFLNSTLQCLAYLPPFCQCLLAMPEPSRPENGKTQKISQGKRITLIIRSLFRRVHAIGEQKGSGAIEPHAIVKAIPTIGMCGSRNGYKFRPGRQEDAHEFLVHLLDAMNDGELRESGINQHASGWRDRLPVPRLDETTFIHRIFGGYLRSQVQCNKCGFRSNTYDPFLDLALEISKKSCCSVAAALNEFTRKETLDPENRWKCSGCGKRVCATKQLTVFRPPLSLCIQMKRFAFTGVAGVSSYGGMPSGYYARREFGMRHGGTKITKPIEFPAEMKLPLSDGRSCEYSLTGIVIHVGGSASSGHYTAYVKKPASTMGSNQWHRLDDSFVEPVSEKNVLKQKDAYLLFYCRKEVKLEFPPPPGRVSMSAEQAIELSRARSKAHELAENYSFDNMDRNSLSNMKTFGKRRGGSLSCSEKNMHSSRLMTDNLSSSERPLQSEAKRLEHNLASERNMPSAAKGFEDKISNNGRHIKPGVKRKEENISPAERTTQSGAKRTSDNLLGNGKNTQYTGKGLVDGIPINANTERDVTQEHAPDFSASERTNVVSNRSLDSLSTSERTTQSSPKKLEDKISNSERATQCALPGRADGLSSSESTKVVSNRSQNSLSLGDKNVQYLGKMSTSEKSAQYPGKRLTDRLPTSERSNMMTYSLSGSEKTAQYAGNISASERTTEYSGERLTERLSDNERASGQITASTLVDGDIQSVVKKQAHFFDSRRAKALVHVQSQLPPMDDRYTLFIDNKKENATRESIPGTTETGEIEDVDAILGVLAKKPRLKPDSNEKIIFGDKSISRITAGHGPQKLPKCSESFSELSLSNSNLLFLRHPAGEEDTRKSTLAQSTIGDNEVAEKGKPSLQSSPPPLEKSKPVPSNDSSAHGSVHYDSSSDESVSSNSSKAKKDGSLLVGVKGLTDNLAKAVRKEKSPAQLRKKVSEKDVRNLNTRIVFDGDGTRAKVSVMLGPRRKIKAWNPKTVVLSKGIPSCELLGNQSIDKWDSDNDEINNKFKSKLISSFHSRSQLVQELEKEASLKKRKMRLDRWDAVLDEGKKKKIKNRDENIDDIRMDCGPDTNVFQKIQSGIQRMNRSGKAKKIQTGKAKRVSAGKVQKSNRGKAKGWFRQQKPGTPKSSNTNRQQRPRTPKSASSTYSC